MKRVPFAIFEAKYKIQHCKYVNEVVLDNKSR